MNTLLTLLLLISGLFTIIGVLFPNFLRKFLKKDMTRKNNLKIYGLLTVFLFFLVGFTGPETNNSSNEINNEYKNQVNPLGEKSFNTNNISNNLNNVEKLANKNSYLVVKVVDGDTLDVSIDGNVERLRLIGIDTPETVDPRKPVQCFGVEASNKSRETLLDKKVFIEGDSTQGERDKYDRLLRYVFLEDGTNFNLMMIKEGYAYEYTYNLPYKYQSEFKEAQKYAENNKVGLWAPNACEEKTTTKNVIVPKTTTSSQCNSNYSGCLKSNTGDYDCAAGSGDGPNYTGTVQVLGYDEFKLDRDGDGWACE